MKSRKKKKKQFIESDGQFSVKSNFLGEGEKVGTAGPTSLKFKQKLLCFHTESGAGTMVSHCKLRLFFHFLAAQT